jgi:hypothetical protein
VVQGKRYCGLACTTARRRLSLGLYDGLLGVVLVAVDARIKELAEAVLRLEALGREDDAKGLCVDGL